MKYKRDILIFGIVFIGLFLFITPTRADTRTTVSQKAACVLSSNPNTNYGNDVDLGVGGPVSVLCITYIEFDITDLPSNIQKASIVLNIYDLGGGTMDLDFYVAEDTWDESTITWNNRPTRLASIGTLDITHAAEWTIELTGIDLTQYGNYITFELASDSTEVMWIRSDDTSYPPELKIDFTPAAGGLPVGAIIGIVVGIGAAAAIGGFLISRSRKKKREEMFPEEGPKITEPVEPVVEKPPIITKPIKPVVEKPPIITEPVKPAVEKPPITTKPMKPVVEKPPIITKPVISGKTKVVFCPSCGEKVEGTFCTQCGIEIQRPPVNRENLIQDIEKVFQVSGIRIDLEMLRHILPIDDAEFNDKIFDLANRFNFKIELEILHITEEKKEEFINALIEALDVHLVH